MALFFVAQGPAVHAQGARSNHGAAIGQKCERSDAALPGRETRPPATEAQHDCETCLACVFASIIDERPRFLASPVPANGIAAAFPEDFPAPVPRWRAAHPARAPPLFS
ncbi:hypothetical protein ACNHKD_11220 [Methylocystis sp. JAN1]|uniref:hypothetical protein n=1 Tax=Methylocystis sp. JAN1 TaxID=3397211 RepID=UPI003FA1D8A4